MSDLVSVIAETSYRIHTFPSIAVQQCLIVKLVKFSDVFTLSYLTVYTTNFKRKGNPSWDD